MSSHQEVDARGDGVELAGSLWWPDTTPRALILMYPGSGPSDRDNDVLFPPIRDVLLSTGVAVCSFDKRGVGGSTGRWEEAGIREQAADLRAGLAAARAVTGDLPTGLFGHSQGGWVVIEAGSAVQPSFLITNSGPAVSPRFQERFSTTNLLRNQGWDVAKIRTAIQTLDRVFDLCAAPYLTGYPRLLALPLIAELRDAGAFLPANEAEWCFAGSIADYDPAVALRQVGCPFLALLGAEDSVVPAALCAEIFTATVAPGLLTVRVLPNADHRFNPISGPVTEDAFVPDYLTTIREFVTSQLE